MGTNFENLQMMRTRILRMDTHDLPEAEYKPPIPVARSWACNFSLLFPNSKTHSRSPLVQIRLFTKRMFDS